MRWIFYSLITAILFSCKEKGAVYSEPDDLIPRDTMVILLKDGSYSEILDSLNREASMFEPSQMVKKDTVLLPQNRQGKGPLSVRPTF